VVDTIVFPEGRTRWLAHVVGRLARYPGLWRRAPAFVRETGQTLTELFHGGARVLLDKDGLVPALERAAAAVPAPTPKRPSPQAFQRNVDGFWLDPPRVVAHLKRGKVLGAMEGLRAVRKQLFKMAEWHGRSKKGWVDDGTWYRAKLIDQRADPQVVEALPRVYPHYDAEDVWRALFAMMELYGWLVAETGELLGYDTSAEVGERVSAWVHGCFGEEAG
jgi:hypothetical protein